MSDSIVNKESIIVQKRLKNLYSYSKQSLAPAVSTVGFFFFSQQGFVYLKEWLKKQAVSILSKVNGSVSAVPKTLLTYSTWMCIADTLMNNVLFLVFGLNTLMISTRIGNGKKS
jgi:hypothetical protein